MAPRTSFVMAAFLAGCASASQQPPPAAGVAAGPDAAPHATASPAASAGPSDWALAIVGTPFVFAFRVVTCAATAVVAGPTAGLLAFSEERELGMAYVRDGLAQNCGPPYAVPVPVAGPYAPDPYLEQPRPLTLRDEAAVMIPRRLAAATPYTGEN